MRLFAACAVVTVLWGVSAAGPALAQVGEDSVVGSGTTSGGFDVRFDIDAHSGPSGENPTGTAGLQRVHSPSTSLRGRVTCLTVTGNRAVIGVENSLGSEPAAGALWEVWGGPGDTLGVEFLNAVPTVCPAPLDLFPNPVELGDIVVTDAKPFPTSKDQCKNGGWRNFGATFKNQGQCVSFVATGGKKQP